MSDLKQDEEEFHLRLSRPGITPTFIADDPRGKARLAHARFEANDAGFEASSRLMITLCTAHIGRIRRQSADVDLEGVLRPGAVVIGLPDTEAQGYWSKTDMLGLAIDLPAYLGEDASDIINRLIPAASTIHHDPLLTAVMTALWRDCEINGMSSAFFDEGIKVLINRLSEFSAPPKTLREQPPLAGTILSNTLELIDAAISTDISVTELARHAELDTTTFSRSFKAAMGYTPFAYLTQTRMKRAKELLQTSLPVTDIALMVGYNNPSKFSAAFRKYYSCTPSQWRKNWQA